MHISTNFSKACDDPVQILSRSFTKFQNLQAWSKWGKIFGVDIFKTVFGITLIPSRKQARQSMNENWSKISFALSQSTSITLEWNYYRDRKSDCPILKPDLGLSVNTSKPIHYYQKHTWIWTEINHLSSSTASNSFGAALNNLGIVSQTLWAAV